MSVIGSGSGMDLDPAVTQAARDAAMPEETTNKRLPKIRIPDTYDGTRTALKRFFMQCDVYLSILDEQFEDESDKVMFAVSLLRGTAADFMEPYVRDWMDHDSKDDMKRTTVTMFTDFAAFKQSLTNMYGDVSKARRAEQEIMALRQGGTIAEYTSKFQQLMARAGWDNDGVAVAQYYRGLKEAVKDQLHLRPQGRPKDMHVMIRACQDIDERYQERQMEKRGFQTRTG